MYKRNAGKVLNINIVAINKISVELKNNYFKIPHYAYTHRYLQCDDAINL